MRASYLAGEMARCDATDITQIVELCDHLARHEAFVEAEMQLMPTSVVRRESAAIAVLPMTERADIDAVTFQPIGQTTPVTWVHRGRQRSEVACLGVPGGWLPRASGGLPRPGVLL